ncbi:MAG TPA: DUF2726 domain-containing protein [Anaerolineales bacterium]|jgi:predicted RNA-binding Zn-ribbon protein involved in translation (DUF1610 family)
MTNSDKFTLLRTILKSLGLSHSAVDDIVDRITDWLTEKDDEKSTRKIEYPYSKRDDFLSPAELSFYLVLKNSVADFAIVCPKVALGDLFYVKSKDNSLYRTYTNKIDRKHVDFLLCESKTVRPVLGIELDDKSHQRQDRQERDDFVEAVFSAAKLPLLRIPVKHTYSVTEVTSQVLAYIGKTVQPSTPTPVISTAASSTPTCPKCGSEMIMRTAKNGLNQGDKFWGCPNYPRCRGVLKFSV